MAIITKITVQQKNSDRYNIYMDFGKGEEYAFSVDEDVLLKFQLKKGLELDEFALTEIGYQDEIRKAYNQSVHYLSARMRSETEVRKYLCQKEIAGPIINEVIHKLYHNQFLNDEEFALAFVRTLMKTTDKGTEAIKRELTDKGITESIIEKAILEYPFSTQVETALRLAQKYVDKNTRDSARILKQKLEQTLFRKGFTFDVIRLVLTEIKLDKEKAGEQEALVCQGEKLLRKYSNYKGVEFEQKVKQALFRKGFSMDLIETFLTNNKTE